jgi:hypothetical protein
MNPFRRAPVPSAPQAPHPALGSKSGRPDVPLNLQNTGLPQFPRPTSPRATISRMISLVPSRIWCTRRSRTIFSMP